MLLLFGGVVREEIELDRLCVLLRRVCFRQDMIGNDIHAADQQIAVCDPVKKSGDGAHDFAGGGGVAVKIDGAVCLLRDFSSVAVGFDFAVVSGLPDRIGQILNVVTDGENHLIGDKTLLHQIQNELVRHFADDKSGFVCFVGTLQDLTGAKAAGAWAIGLDCCNGGGLPAPCVIDEELRIFAKKRIKQIFILFRAESNIPHRIHSVLFQFSGNSAAYAPEIRERPMRPELTPEFHFIELRNADTVFIRRDVLRDDVHCGLAEKEVGADSGGRRDAGGFQNLQNDFSGEVVCSEPVDLHIIGDVQKHFIDGVDYDVFRSDVFQINLIDAGAVLHVECHPGRRDDEVNRKLRICLQLGEKTG